MIRPLLAALLVATASGAIAQNYAIPQPSAGLMPNPGKGKQLFDQHCAACHGVDLKGNEKGDKKGPPLRHKVYEPSHHGDAAFQLAVLHKVYEPSHHGDAAFQLAAKNGVRAHHWPYGDMAPVPQVTPDDVAHITAYVRAEQRKVGIR